MDKSTIDLIISSVKSRRVSHTDPKDLRVVQYVDFFRENEAPFFMEERIGSSGRSYEVKVYAPEAYSEDYMHRSEETGRLIRWGVRLSDGRTVSRDGAFRIRFPDKWDDIKSLSASRRGDKRDEFLALSLWRMLAPEEREAMIASVDVASYADGRGDIQAESDLRRDLKESGSLLHWVNINWHMKIFVSYRDKFLGPTDDHLQSSPWNDYILYKFAKSGTPLPTVIDPQSIPIFDPKTGKINSIWRLSSEYWSLIPKGDRVAERLKIFGILRKRFGRNLMDYCAAPFEIPGNYSYNKQQERRSIYLNFASTMDEDWSKSITEENMESVASLACSILKNHRKTIVQVL